MKRLLAAGLAALGLVALPANADQISEWIAAQPPEWHAVLQAGQQEPRFKVLHDTCPADVFPGLSILDDGIEACSDRPGWCLVQCRLGYADACFELARGIEIDLEDTHEGNFKFPFDMAACRAGHANGCTNAGATVKNGTWFDGTRPATVESRACQFQTYDKACEAGATWGCLMLGLEWGVEGVNGEINRDKAIAAWQRSCNLRPDSGACESSRARLDRFLD